MVRPSLEAHFLVPCRAVPWNGPAGPNTSRNLEDVAYTYRTETPDGFPYETEFWLFTRLAHRATRAFTRECSVETKHLVEILRGTDSTNLPGFCHF